MVASKVCKIISQVATIKRRVSTDLNAILLKRHVRLLNSRTYTILKDGWQKDAGALYVLMLGNIRKSIVAPNKNTRVGTTVLYNDVHCTGCYITNVYTTQ